MGCASLFWQRRFVSALPGLLHRGVVPEGLERAEEVHGEGLAVAQVARVLDHLGVRQVLVEHLEVHVLHRLEHVLEPAREVVEDELALGLDLLRRERQLVDEAHLLGEGQS